jgi:RNA polymerase sigma-70 factor (ECF subfamily)
LNRKAIRYDFVIKDGEGWARMSNDMADRAQETEPREARSPEEVFEEILVMLAQAGDREALERLARRWSPRHYAHARRLLGRPDAAADAVQEAWIGIVRGLRTLADPARFPAWSFAIVTRRCRDAQRRAGRAPALDPDAEPEAQVSDAGESQDLRRALAALPEDQRAAVALYYIEGFSIAEIAEALRAPEGTIKSRLFHARRALKRHMEGELS